MKLLDAIRAPFQRKSQVYTLEQIGSLAEFSRGTSSGVAVTPATAVQMTAVLCAVRVISEDIAGMPARIVTPSRIGPHMAQEVVTDHWAARLLARPNGFQTPFEFKEYVILSCLLGRNGFLGIKNTVQDEVREILPLPMDAFTVHRDPGQWEPYYQVSYDAETIGRFRASDVVHMRGPSLNGWEALPMLKAAREAIGLAQAMEKQQARLAGNGGKPSGVLSFEESLSPDTIEKIREHWQERYGPNGDGGIAVFDRAAEFASMTMTSVDAQVMEARSFQIEEVARAFRVHPNKLMHSGNQSTFASAESFARAHVQDALMPWMRRFEEVMSRDVLGSVPNLRVDLDESAHLRGNMSETAAYLTKMLGAGGHQQVMTTNEARAQVGLNPIAEEWADQLPRVDRADIASDMSGDGAEKDLFAGILEGLGNV